MSLLQISKYLGHESIETTAMLIRSPPLAHPFGASPFGRIPIAASQAAMVTHLTAISEAKTQAALAVLHQQTQG